MTEQLTAEERNMLDDISPTFGGKALRVIDQLTQSLAAEKQRSEDWIEIAQDHCLRREAAEARASTLTDDERGEFLRMQVAVIAADGLVQNLTRERNEARANVGFVGEALTMAESQVTRLTEALAAERSECNHRRVRAEAAEARVRELTERVSQALTGLRPGSPVREALEEALRG